MSEESRSKPTAVKVPLGEEEAVRLRRIDAGMAGTDGPPVALALSGGGIRSATFCLGLLRALAKNDVLRRFDYLSTVSGGGYIGSAFGRLYSSKAGADEVTAGLAREDSLLLWWLRRNGRFLLPAGASDLLQAGANVFRGMVATHLEIAILAVLLSCFVIAPHLFVGPVSDLRAVVATPWWALLPFNLMLIFTLIFAYWFSRDDRSFVSIGADLAVVGGLGVLVWNLWPSLYLSMHQLATGSGEAPAGVSVTVLAMALIVAVSLQLGWLLRWLLPLFSVRARLAREARVKTTAYLAWAILLTAVIALLGLMDLASWLIAERLHRVGTGWLLGGSGGAAGLVVLVRVLLPAVQPLIKQSGHGLALDHIANVVGLMFTALVLLFWLVACQWFVFYGDSILGLSHAPLRWLALFGAAFVYLAVTGHHLEQLNRASLHPFYRSRLARAYVATGNSPDAENPAKPPRFVQSPLASWKEAQGVSPAKVTMALDGDDLPIDKYAPHLHGGPIHLINCCINQTVDDRTGSFNADRKGLPLTIGPFGAEIGSGMPATEAALKGTDLSDWIAISGAAVGSGMGSLTRPGIAAMTFLTGFRLGYWWFRFQPSGAVAMIRRITAKSIATFNELLAFFPGLGRGVAYLSDGGHFDNTGIYALLKRRPRLIVAADCGADPDYLFADFESLVRKARIDHHCAIDVIDPQSFPDTGLSKRMRGCFGTPDSIVPTPGYAYLVLARIRYEARDGETQPQTGALLLVKPRRIERLPLDVAGYSDRDPGFPQQSTGDQFFDEAQWESYCQLGLKLGEAVDSDLLGALPHWAEVGTALGSRDVGGGDDAKDAGSRRARFASTVIGKSIGVGAVASIFLAGWQAWDGHLNELRSNDQKVVSSILGLREEVGKLGTAGAPISAADLKEIAAKLAVVNIGTGDSATRKARDLLADALDQKCAPAVANTSPPDCSLLIAQLRGRKPAFWVDPVRAYWTLGPAIEPPSASTIFFGLAGLLHLPMGGSAMMAAPEPSEGGHINDLPPTSAGPGPDASLPQRPAETATASIAAADVKKACAPAGLAPAVLSIHVYPDSDRELAKRAATAAAEAGLTVAAIENAIADATGALPAEARTPMNWKQAAVLYLPGDQSCASGLSSWLRQSGILDSSLQALPTALDSSRGALHLWIPARSRVYIQYRSELSQALIDGLRMTLRSSDRIVPSAERIERPFPSLVKYFHDEDLQAAQALAGQTTQFLSQAGRRCEPKAVRAGAASVPSGQLELWLGEDCAATP